MEDKYFDYVIEYDQIRDLTIGQLKYHLRNARGRKLSELKLTDLSSYNDELIFPGTGVYIFKVSIEDRPISQDEKLIYYVGKVSSQSFTERIGNHMDPRWWAWMNGMLKYTCTRELGYDKLCDKGMKAAWHHAVKNVEVVLIHMPEPKEKINALETLLRKACRDAHNCLKQQIGSKEKWEQQIETILPSQTVKVA